MRAIRRPSVTLYDVDHRFELGPAYFCPTNDLLALAVLDYRYQRKD